MKRMACVEISEGNIRLCSENLFLRMGQYLFLMPLLNYEK